MSSSYLSSVPLIQNRLPSMVFSSSSSLSSLDDGNNRNQGSVKYPMTMALLHASSPASVHDGSFLSNNNNENKKNNFSTMSSPSSNPPPMASKRGLNAVSLLPSYLSDARAVEKYHPVNAPNGALQLSVAENQMMEDLLSPSIRRFQSNVKFSDDMIYYQATHGMEGLRVAFCNYLSRLLLRSPEASTSTTPDTYGMDTDGLIVGAGCNAVLENLCITLAEAGDGVLIPTPYYAAFEFDCVARAQLKVIPVHTFHDNDYSNLAESIPAEAYYPTAETLNKAYLKSIEEDGVTPKILLLSHPNNPLGICYPPSVLRECLDWAEERGVHIISDEIYAGSVYDQHRTGESDCEESAFTSMLTVASEKHSPNQTTNDGDNVSPSKRQLNIGPYVHLVYALSKDFCLSGLRVGALYTENESIRMPLYKLNDFCQISSTTQQLVQAMLEEEVSSSRFWTDHFLEQSAGRIYDRVNTLQQTCRSLQIPFLSSDSTLFLWIDLREFLPSPSPENNSKDIERELYLDLVKNYGLLFTPGDSMRTELPGFFRIVFTAASDKEFALALERLERFVKEKRA